MAEKLARPATGETASAVHVVPINDLREHDESGLTCWCDPTVETFPTGGVLVVHNSADGRELVEKHGVN